MFALGRMRGMAGETALLTGHRGMLERNVLALLFMAFKTESVHLSQLKLRVLGSMRGMAGQTFPLFKRTMLHSTPRFKLCNIVAVVAELTSGLRGRKGF